MELLSTVSSVSAEDDLELLQPAQQRAVYGLHNAIFAMESQYQCSSLPLNNVSLEVDRCNKMLQIFCRNHDVRIAVAKAVGHAAIRDLSDLIERFKVGDTGYLF